MFLDKITSGKLSPMIKQDEATSNLLWDHENQRMGEINWNWHKGKDFKLGKSSSLVHTQERLSYVSSNQKLTIDRVGEDVFEWISKLIPKTVLVLALTDPNIVVKTTPMVH